MGGTTLPEDKGGVVFAVVLCCAVSELFAPAGACAAPFGNAFVPESDGWMASCEVPFTGGRARPPDACAAGEELEGSAGVMAGGADTGAVGKGPKLKGLLGGGMDAVATGGATREDPVLLGGRFLASANGSRTGDVLSGRDCL